MLLFPFCHRFFYARGALSEAFSRRRPRLLYYGRRFSRHVRNLNSDQGGYALPSLLFLVVVLSLLALAALTHSYLQKQLALRSVFRVKAEYAAQSALAKTITSLGSVRDYATRIGDSRQQIDFQDGSQATVEAQRWGCYCLMTATGAYKKTTARRTALVAQIPGPSFNDALVFANTSHQLVFAGSTAIKGRVTTGPLGASAGTLGGQPGMRQSLLNADIRKEKEPRLPVFSRNDLANELDSYERLFKGERSKNTSNQDDQISFSTRPALIDGSEIPIETRYIVSDENAILKGVFNRGDTPLYIIARGRISFQSTAQLNGPIALIAGKEITVTSGVHIDHAILYSATRVEFKESTEISAQVFSPFIVLRSGSVASYPSLLVSTFPKADSSATVGIVIEGGATIEGTILSFGAKAENENQLVIIQPGASVTGAIYSENMVTLDGKVAGTVMTKDFYFHVQPTKYLGWLRSARIDRSLRPRGFLLPIGFAESFRLDILEWL